MITYKVEQYVKVLPTGCNSETINGIIKDGENKGFSVQSMQHWQGGSIILLFTKTIQVMSTPDNYVEPK